MLPFDDDGVPGVYVATRFAYEPAEYSVAVGVHV
jgi:hypothetical protein